MDEWRELRCQYEALSIPGFLKAEAAYCSAPSKILFVGQETHGWWTNCSDALQITTAEVMNEFVKIRKDLDGQVNRYRSPYWQMLRYVARELGIANPQAYLFSNIFPCSFNRGRAPENFQSIFRRWNLFALEIDILGPDWVVFLCGPLNLPNLECFGARPNIPMPTDPLRDYQPNSGKWRGLITYHPNGLRWLKLTRPVRESIVKRIQP